MKYLWLCLALAVKRGQVSRAKCAPGKKIIRQCWKWSTSFWFSPTMIFLQAASCTINAPLETSTGSDLGFIMIPGAQVLLAFVLVQVQVQGPGLSSGHLEQKPIHCEKPLRFLVNNMGHWSQRSRNSCLEFGSGPGLPPAGLETSQTRSRLPAPSTTVWARRMSRACMGMCTWGGTASEASCWRPGSRITLIELKVILEER